MSASWFRPHLLSRSRLIAVIGLVLGSQIALTAPAAAEPAALAIGMTDSVNQVRAQAGLPPLLEEPQLDALASERSVDMAARQYLSHTTPEGLTVFNMMEQRGVSFRYAGENLAYNYGVEQQGVATAINGFVNSPPHLANLLNPAYTQIGVGIATTGGRTYFTLVFIG